MDSSSALWDYNAALLFGAVTIVFHSWANFNRPSDVTWDDLGDLVNLLNPSDVRSRQVVNRAFVFYVLILLLIFFVLCSYAQFLSPFLGQQFSSLVEEATRTVGASELPKAGFDPEFLQSPETTEGKSPSVPLAISLAMVGLAPQLAVLREFERRLRLAAHWMSGIPTRLIRGANALLRQGVSLRDEAESWLKDPQRGVPQDNKSLIGPRDWKRYTHYLDFLGKHQIPIDTHELKAHVDTIVAFSNWVLNDRLDCVRHDRWRAHEIETAVQAEIDRFLADMDRATLFEAGGKNAGAQPTPSADLSLGTWRSLEGAAEKTARMAATFVFLLDEHGALDAEGLTDPGDDESERYHRVEEHRKVLRERLSRAQSFADWSEMTFALWGRSFAVLVLASAFAGLMAAMLNLQSGQEIGIWASISAYAQNAIVIYTLPLIAALAMRHSVSRSGQWHNAFRSSWVNWGFQLAEIWLATAAIAVVCTVAQDFASAMSRFGVEVVTARAGDVLLNSLLFNGPTALVGPTLAVGALVLIDAWESGRRRPGEAMVDAGVLQARMGRATLCTLVALGLVATVGRFSASLYANGADFASLSKMASWFFAEKWQFTFTAALTAMLIGAAVCVVIWGSLQGDYRSLVYPTAPGSKGQEGSTAQGPARGAAGQEGA